MAAKKFNRIACLLLSLMLVFSLFSVSVLATESDVTSAVTDESSVATTADTEPAAPAETGEDQATETEKADEETKKEPKKISTGTIVSIAITLVIVVVAAVYCIKNKAKVAKFFRECKSEIKKITWTPKNQIVKNTLVVIVVVVAAAIFVGLLDLVFSQGIGFLVKL